MVRGRPNPACRGHRLALGTGGVDDAVFGVPVPDSFSGKRTVFLIDNAQSLDRSLAARLPPWTSTSTGPRGPSGLPRAVPEALPGRGLRRGFHLALEQRRHCGTVVSRPSGQGGRRVARDRAALSLYRLHDQAAAAVVRGWVVLAVVRHSGSGAEAIGHRRPRLTARGGLRHGLCHAHQTGGGADGWLSRCPLLCLLRGSRLSLRARNAGFSVLVVPRARVHHAAADSDRLSRSIYYSTRNLLEVMRRYGTWVSLDWDRPELPRRWLGFFTVLACLRGRPELLRSLASGVIDFARGRLGERNPGRATAAPGPRRPSEGFVAPMPRSPRREVRGRRP